MAFPPNLYAPPGGGGQQISRSESKAQLALEIARYATSDILEGESMAVDLMPLSYEALKQIRDDLWDYDYLHGRKSPTW